jgi:hypothetical protein
MPVVTGVVAGPEWGNVVRALGFEDEILPAKLHFTLRRDAELNAQRAKQRVARLPVRGHAGHTGLRERVAAGVRVTGSLGFYRITTSMPSGQEIIPRGLDRAIGWTHPVFGHDVEVRQRPFRSGWFLDTFQGAQEEMASHLEDDLEDAADFIAAAGAGP